MKQNIGNIPFSKGAFERSDFDEIDHLLGKEIEFNGQLRKIVEYNPEKGCATIEAVSEEEYNYIRYTKAMEKMCNNYRNFKQKQIMDLTNAIDKAVSAKDLMLCWMKNEEHAKELAKLDKELASAQKELIRLKLLNSITGEQEM